MDCTENISHIIACRLIAEKTACQQSCSLVMAVLLSPVYLAMGLHVTICAEQVCSSSNASELYSFESEVSDGLLYSMQVDAMVVP
jgi:hypothetical protein